MSGKFILTAFSKDRPGIIADISQVIFENGYNLEDSSMTYLAGEFAVLLLLSTPPGSKQDEVVETLSSECRRLEREKGITAFIRPSSGDGAAPTVNGATRTISVEGFDQAGIVYKLSKYLADSQVNIKTLKSAVTLSPQSGTSLYGMDILIDMPEGLSEQSLEDGLGAIGDELNVELTLS